MPSPTVRIMRGTNVYDERQIPENSTVSLFTDTVEGVEVHTVWISAPEAEGENADLTTAGEISVGAGDVELDETVMPPPPEPPPPVEPPPEPAPEPEPEPEPEPAPEP